MSLGSLWGIRMRLSPLFLICAGLWFLIGTPLELALICLVVLGHEFCHALAGRALGLKFTEIELFPFGGVARMDEQLELEPFAERRMAWAGPAFNLAAAGLVVVLYNRFFTGSETALFLIKINLVLAAFNLLPGLPLDGGRILRSYLTPLFGFRRATEQAARLGQVLALLLAAAGLVGWLQRYSSLSLVLVSVFLFFVASRERKQAVYAFLRSLGAKESELLKRGALRAAQLVVLEETRLLEIFRLFLPQRYHFVRVLDRAQRLRAEIPESSLVRAAIREGLDTPVKKII